MVVTQTKAQSDIERRSIRIAFFAGACNILYSVLFSFEIYGRGSFTADYVELIVQFGSLTPLVVVAIGRQIAAITHAYALLLLMILVGEVLYLLGSSPIFGLASHLLSTLLGLFSAFFLLMLAASYLEILIVDALKDRKEPGADG